MGGSWFILMSFTKDFVKCRYCISKDFIVSFSVDIQLISSFASFLVKVRKIGAYYFVMIKTMKGEVDGYFLYSLV